MQKRNQVSLGYYLKFKRFNLNKYTWCSIIHRGEYRYVLHLDDPKLRLELYQKMGFYHCRIVKLSLIKKHNKVIKRKKLGKVASGKIDFNKNQALMWFLYWYYGFAS